MNLGSLLQRKPVHQEGAWSAPDELSVEFETAEFLTALVYLFKPKRILETGSGRLHSTTALYEGMKKNGIGYMCTCDSAVKHTFSEGDFVRFVQCKGEELVLQFQKVDLAFIDGGDSEARFQQMANLDLAPNGICVLHDARRPERERIMQIRNWRQIFIPTPRGLAIFQSREEK